METTGPKNLCIKLLLLAAYDVSSNSAFDTLLYLFLEGTAVTKHLRIKMQKLGKLYSLLGQLKKKANRELEEVLSEKLEKVI